MRLILEMAVKGLGGLTRDESGGLKWVELM